MSKEKPITDLYLVATLVSYGFQWGNVDTTNPDRQRFMFENEGEKRRVFITEGLGAVVKELELDDVEKAYMNKTLLLLPTYSDVLRQVKYSVHSQK